MASLDMMREPLFDQLCSGNWSINEEQFPWDVIPDWCTGFLYITTPQVGAELVQAGNQENVPLSDRVKMQ